VEDAVLASDTWENDSKIADLYLSRMGHFYGSDNSRWGQQLENINLYAKQLSGTDVAMFSRSSNVYGMISSDDPFEYFGSLAMAVRNLDGASPEMVISNLRDAKNPRAEGAAKFLAKELRTRNFHKRWVEEMMKEGYSGAVSLASHLNNFWGWQVVDPNLVRDDQWQESYEVYVDDKLELNIDEWFEQVNPASQAHMLERMLEANRKEYWQADEQTLKAIVERYVELVQQYDLFVDNEKLRTYVDQQAAGFGLNALPAPAEPMPATSSAAAQQQVEGQKLEKVEQAQPDDSEWDRQLLLLFSACFIAIIIGGINQLRRQSRYQGLVN
jgi:cobaltochelatase CobN